MKSDSFLTAVAQPVINNNATIAVVSKAVASNLVHARLSASHNHNYHAENGQIVGQQSNNVKCLARNPGAGGLFDAALLRQVNLAAAFHDHISCTKLPSEICKAGGVLPFLGYGNGNSSQSDSGNSSLSMFGSPFSSQENDKEQITALKDMLMAHLDLIQHQQEQLLKKDRQLQGLKQDREALCLRLEKTEKRVTILSKKLFAANEQLTLKETTIQQTLQENAAIQAQSQADNSSSLDSNGFSNYFAESSLFGKIAEVTPATTPTKSEPEIKEPVDGETTPLPSPKKKVKKDKSALDKTISPKKRSRPSKSADSESSTSSMNVLKDCSISNSCASRASVSETSSKEILTGGKTKANRRKRANNSQGSGKTLSVTFDEEDELAELLLPPPPKVCAIPKEIFTTDSPYDVVMVREYISDLDPVDDITEKSIVCDNESARSLQALIEVPSFRIVNFTTSYSLEGTEVLFH